MAAITRQDVKAFAKVIKGGNEYRINDAFIAMARKVNNQQKIVNLKKITVADFETKLLEKELPVQVSGQAPRNYLEPSKSFACNLTSMNYRTIRSGTQRLGPKKSEVAEAAVAIVYDTAIQGGTGGFAVAGFGPDALKYGAVGDIVATIAGFALLINGFRLIRNTVLGLKEKAARMQQRIADALESEIAGKLNAIKSGMEQSDANSKA